MIGLSGRRGRPFQDQAPLTTLIMARLAGFEPATDGLEVNASELPNLLNLLEAVDITEFQFSKSLPILAVFSIFGISFHTQIHTQARPFPVGWGQWTLSFSVSVHPLSPKRSIRANRATTVSVLSFQAIWVDRFGH
jgi:hypothetical protein